MPAPISMDLRLRLVGAVERGSSIRAAARRVAVSPAAAIELMQRVRATGSAAPARSGGHRRRVLERHDADLRRLVAAPPDLTLAEIQRELQQRGSVRAGLSTIHNALRRIGLRHKKVLKSGRAGPARRRRPAPAVACLAALHGSGAVCLYRRDRHRHQHGPALRPRPARRAPGRRRAAGPLADHDVRRGAPAERRHRAAGARWPDDRDRLPCLRRAIPGASARARRRRGARQPRRAQGRRRPPGARRGRRLPRLLAAVFARPNPIEQLFAKLKALLRKAAARTRDELWSTIGHLLATVPPPECARYLHHCDYGST